MAGGASPASQTLVRGLDVLEMVATGPVGLPALANRLGLARSTAHRLATALLERRYLTLMPREGYGLGPKLLELGFCARQQTFLVRIARPHMEALAAETQDTVHLTIQDGETALLLERIEGRRLLLPTLRIGERAALTRCAAGCSLLLDGSERAWREAFAQDSGSASSAADGSVDAFVERQLQFGRSGYTYQPGETDDRISTVAAPVRGGDGAIVAAIGVSAASQYLDATRIPQVARAVCRVAAAISGELGFPPAKNDSSGGDGVQDSGVFPRGDACMRNNEAISAYRTQKPLEAEASRGHDPFLNGARHAKKTDLGLT